MRKGFVIAIDGPVASGKGTAAPTLAAKLHGFYLYTGATYRALALYCIQQGIEVTDTKAVIAAVDNVSVDLFDHTVMLNGEDITDTIKRADVARLTPVVAAIPEVRRAMVKRQHAIAHQRIAEGKIVVIEGRDTGTVVFPEAALKVFLTAKPEVRAQRRLEQYQAMGTTEVTYEQVLADLQERDKADTQRKIDPLVTDPEKHGYHIIDTSGNTQEETVAEIVSLLETNKLL